MNFKAKHFCVLNLQSNAGKKREIRFHTLLAAMSFPYIKNIAFR